MKFKILLSLVISVLYLSAFAQTTSIRIPKNAQKCIDAVLRAQQISNVELKGTEVQQRLVAYRTLYNYQLDDSFRFSYSGNRKSNFNYNKEEPLYDNTFGLQYYPDPALYFDQNPLDMPADSIITVYDAGQTSSNRLKGFYRVDNKIDSSYELQDLGQNNVSIKNLNSFTPQGYIKQEVTLEPNDTIGLIKFTYSADGSRLVADSTYGNFGMPSTVFAYQTYHHNTLGLLDTVLFFNNDPSSNTASLDNRLMFFYDTQNRITRILYYQYNYYNQTQTVNVKVDDSMAYTGSSGIYTFISEKTTDYLGNTFEPFRIIKTLGANNLTDTFLKITYGVSTDSLIYKFTYNEFNNPDSIALWYNEDSVLQSYRFYYETFDDNPPPVNSINNIGIVRLMSFYPNPVTNDISLLWKGERYNASIEIYNTIGVLIMKKKVGLQPGVNTIGTVGLPAGQYMLRLVGSDNATVDLKFIKE